MYLTKKIIVNFSMSVLVMRINILSFQGIQWLGCEQPLVLLRAYIPSFKFKSFYKWVVCVLFSLHGSFYEYVVGVSEFHKLDHGRWY